MSLKPFNDRILIHQTKAPEHFTSSDGVSNSKIIIPDDIKKKNQPNTGLILAVGELVKEKHPDLKIGEIVLFEKYCGADVELLNNNGVVMKDLKMVKYEDLISGFVDDAYFYDDILKPIREAEEKQKADEELRLKQLADFKESIAASNSKAVYIYQCWNSSCSAKLKEVEKKETIDLACEYCGAPMTEKQTGPQIFVKGGTPRFS
jgi:co-chaperonin GroES (HSP10)/DNA-directed RNA polymerase subunit RPC12/RpoP